METQMVYKVSRAKYPVTRNSKGDSKIYAEENDHKVYTGKWDKQN